MIYPQRITNFRRTVAQLQELLLFCMFVTGKNSDVVARNLDRLLTTARAGNPALTPFEALRPYAEKGTLGALLRAHGIGCHNRKARSIAELLASGLDLRHCSAEDLERIYDIGPKSSRLFLMHSRRRQKVAAGRRGRPAYRRRLQELLAGRGLTVRRRQLNRLMAELTG